MATRLPLRILLAEDHSSNQKLALLTLGKLGYRADVAANGLEVLSALERQAYDVILMDMQMPEMDGLEATRRIRQERARENGPRIIAMTANVTKEDRRACFDAGMDDYLSKPIRVNELVAALNKSVPLAREAVAVAAPAARASATPLPVAFFDSAAMAHLHALVGGDRGALSELITSYLNDTLKLLRDLRQALETNRPDLLRRAAHSLKSSSRDFGALGLSALGRQLEEIGKDNRVSGAAELIAQAESAYEPLRIMLQQISSGA
jgi:CheY-like chemotaxis protein